MKRVIILSVFAFFGFAAHTLAAEGFTALAPIIGLTDGGATSAVNSDTLASFFNNLYKYLIGLAATLAVIMIIWGGLEYATTDSVGNKEKGRERIQQAIFGLVLVLSPALVFSIINPSILNLSLNLPELDTKSGGVPTAIQQQKLGCNDPSLTNEQRKACSSAQNVIGTNPSSPASSADIRYYFEGGGKQVYEQTLADQVKACNDAGGLVSGDSLYRDKSNSRCSAAGEKYATSHGYAACTLLVNSTSVCFSK